MSISEQVQVWCTLLNGFEEWRDNVISRSENREFKRYFSARYYTEKASPEDLRTGVPLIFTYADVKLSSLDKSFPQFLVVRRDRRYEQESNAAEAVLSYEARENNWRKQMRKALREALLQDYGGWCKIGYSSEFALQNKHSDRDGYRTGDGKEAVEFNEDIQSEHPWVRQISGLDVAFDWQHCSEISDSRWMAFRSRQSLSAAIKDPSIEDGAKVALRSKFAGLKFDKMESLQIERWEIWDKRDKTVCVIYPEIKDHFLIKPRAWPFDLEGFPCVQIKFFDGVDADGGDIPVFGMAPVRVHFNTNEALNALRSDDITASRRLVPKYCGEFDLFSGKGEAIFEGRAIGSYVPTKHGKAPNLIPLPNGRNDNRLLAADLMQDFRWGTAIEETSAGISDLKERTATEVTVREENASSRNASMQDAYDEAWGTVARKTLLIIQKFYPPHRVIPVYEYGKDAPVDWTKFDDDWKKAEYGHVGIYANSTARPSKDGRRQRAMQLAGVLPQLIMGVASTSLQLKQMGRSFNESILMRGLLREMDNELFSSAELQEMWPDAYDAGDPSQENAIIMAGGRVFVAPGDDDDLHLDTHIRMATMIQDPELSDQAMAELGTPDLETLRNDVLPTLLEHIDEHESKKALKMERMRAAASQGAGVMGQGQGSPGMQQPPNMAASGLPGMGGQSVNGVPDAGLRML